MPEVRHLYLVLGDQLNHSSIIWDNFDPGMDMVWMAEVSRESAQVTSSNQRTVLFLSAMRHFAAELKKKSISVCYFKLSDKHENFESALDAVQKKFRIDSFKCVLPGDYRVYGELEKYFKKKKLQIEWLEDNHFITRPGEFREWMQSRKQPRMEHWYRYLRKDRDILMDNNKPEGGKWNYDKENRKAFGKAGPGKLPGCIKFKADTVTKSVIQDVKKFLPGLYGNIEDFQWPVTRKDALRELSDFINHRLAGFGDYQDAMWTGEYRLYHSRIASSLNLKLLDPMEVINSAINAYQKKRVSLNAVEGFIRQILGWREYIRGLYWHYRDKWLATNHLGAKRSLPDFYWSGQTNMVCMKECLRQVIDTGYGHHIQRLMVTGLFSLLYGVKPEEIHEWYLAMYTDAVAWVEVPNTLGMSQYSDGGLVGSKPYIASGAYINRMSNYCSNCRYQPGKASGEEACPFTTLFWKFVEHHQTLLANNPRLAMQVRNWNNKDTSEQKAILERTTWLLENIESL